MTKNQKVIIGLLKKESEKLFDKGEFELQDKLNDVILALTDKSTVLALILAEIYEIPEIILEKIRFTFKVKKVS